MGEVYWGYLRAIYRETKAYTRDEGAAMFAMAKMAREDNCPDTVLRGLVQDLRDEGAITDG